MKRGPFQGLFSPYHHPRYGILRLDGLTSLEHAIVCGNVTRKRHGQVENAIVGQMQACQNDDLYEDRIVSMLIQNSSSRRSSSIDV